MLGSHTLVAAQPCSAPTAFDCAARTASKLDTLFGKDISMYVRTYILLKCDAAFVTVIFAVFCAVFAVSCEYTVHLTAQYVRVPVPPLPISY